MVAGRGGDERDGRVRRGAARDEQHVGGLGLRVRDARLLLDDGDDVDPGVVEDCLDSPRVDRVVDGDEGAYRRGAHRPTSIVGVPARSDSSVTDEGWLTLAPRGRTQDEPHLAVVGRESKLSGLAARDADGQVMRAVAVGLLAGIWHPQHQDVLDERAQLRTPGTGRGVGGVEASEHVDLVAGAHIADQAVRGVEGHRDRALVAAEPAPHGVGASGEVRRGELLARVDVARSHLVGERGAAR